MRLSAYLTFNGNCRHAMEFYQTCLGGQLELQTVGDSPLSENLPGHMRACILEATLRNGRMLLTGTDLAPETGVSKGNAVSLMLNCPDEPLLIRTHAALADGGKPGTLVRTAWDALFGHVVDKFGNHWLLRSP